MSTIKGTITNCPKLAEGRFATIFGSPLGGVPAQVPIVTECQIIPSGRFQREVLWLPPESKVCLEIALGSGKRVVTDRWIAKQDVRLRWDGTAFVLDDGGGNPDVEPLPGLSDQFRPGTFTASISAYGLLGASRARMENAIDFFAAHKFGNVRAWDWDHDGSPPARVFQSTGALIPAAGEILRRTLDYAGAHGVSLDFTLTAGAFDTHKVSDEGYDISAHKRAIRTVLEQWGMHPALRIFDMANEAEARGPSPGSGSPAHGHVSPGRLKEMWDVVKSAPHRCLCSVSVSGGGDFGDVIKNYQALFRDVKTDLCLAHWPRKTGWGANEGPQARQLKAAVHLDVFNDEPARNGYNGQNWSVEEFKASFRSAKANGALGECLHNDAGFDLTQRDFDAQLDPIERAVVDWVAAGMP